MRVVLLIAIALISSTARPSPAAHTSVNHTKSWRIYHNQRLGFSIKYPRSWQADDHEGEYNPVVVICPRNPRPHEFYITISIENRTLDQVRQSYAEFTRKSPTSHFLERQILFANKTAYQFRRTDNPGFYAVYIPVSEKMYVVSAVRFDISEVRTSIRSFSLGSVGSAVYSHDAPNKSLDASGGCASLN